MEPTDRKEFEHAQAGVSAKSDITGSREIEMLVDRFYERVRQDDLLAPIFEKVAQVDWATHLPRLYAFWQAVLFGQGRFRGNPLGVHLRLAGQTEIDWPQFQRWTEMFGRSVDELFVGENAEHIKRIAEDMANVIHTRIQQTRTERID